MFKTTKISFQELKALNGKSIDELMPIEEPREPEKGMLNINGTTVFNCFSHKVNCDNEVFAFIHFYDRKGNEVANVSLSNVDNECLIIKNNDHILSETQLRMMNQF